MGFLYNLQRAVFRFIGDIRWSGITHPFWFTINSTGYQLKGEHYRQLKPLLQPGDILIRRFEGYIDKWFIPGFWNHAGIYIGDDGNKPEQIVHAMSEGVIQEDLLNFLRTDHLLVLRSLTNPDKAVQLAKEIVGRPYDFGFDFLDTHRFSCTELVAYCHPGVTSGRKRFFRTIVVADDFEASPKLQKIWDSREHQLSNVVEVFMANRPRNIPRR